MSKKLIINADDYGICSEVNQAIEELITAGKLRNVSIMANSWCYESAAAFLLNNQYCSVGAHLNIVEGVALAPAAKVKSLLGKDGQFVSLSQILRRWMKSPFQVSSAVEIEWRAQIEYLLKTGLKISHADSHQHIHAFPPFWRILINLCREYEIPSIRSPREQNEIRSRRIASFALNQSANISKAVTANKNIKSNDHFLGFKRAGSYGETEMICDLRNLKDGVTELCVHPSICDKVPYPDLRGELEHEALLGSVLWKQIADSKIEIITWTELSKN